MENILTFAGGCQVALCLWVMDWITSVPGLILGAVIFVLLVNAVREVLRDAKPVPAPVPRRKVTRIV